MRLLVTERDPLVRRWLGLRAEELGIHLQFADSGVELLEAIDIDPPDCVVMDASSSTEARQDPLWRRLRESPATSHIPILLYSSSNRWQRVAELAGETVDGYLARPFTPDLMLSAAQQAAGRTVH